MPRRGWGSAVTSSVETAVFTPVAGTDWVPSIAEISTVIAGVDELNSGGALLSASREEFLGVLRTAHLDGQLGLSVLLESHAIGCRTHGGRGGWLGPRWIVRAGDAGG